MEMMIPWSLNLGPSSAEAPRGWLPRSCPFSVTLAFSLPSFYITKQRLIKLPVINSLNKFSIFVLTERRPSSVQTCP